MLIRRLRIDDFKEVMILLETLQKKEDILKFYKDEDDFKAKFWKYVMTDTAIAVTIIDPKTVAGFIVGKIKSSLFHPEKICEIEAVYLAPDMKFKNKVLLFEELIKICRDKKIYEIEIIFTQKDIWLEEMTVALGFDVKGIYRHKTIIQIPSKSDKKDKTPVKSKK